MAKNIVIYKGIVRILYADGVTLEKNKVVPTVKSEIIAENEEFYPFMRKLVHVPSNTVLPSEDEAYDYMSNVIESRTDDIREVLTSDEYSEEQRATYLANLARISSCPYFKYSEAHPDHTISRQELNEIKGKRAKH